MRRNDGAGSSASSCAPIPPMRSNSSTSSPTTLSSGAFLSPLLIYEETLILVSFVLTHREGPHDWDIVFRHPESGFGHVRSLPSLPNPRLPTHLLSSSPSAAGQISRHPPLQKPSSQAYALLLRRRYQRFVLIFHSSLSSSFRRVFLSLTLSSSFLPFNANGFHRHVRSSTRGRSFR